MGQVKLAIKRSEIGYSLGYAGLNNGCKWLEPISMEIMTADSPRGMSLTGMIFGFYSFGELQMCLEPADFASA